MGLALGLQQAQDSVPGTEGTCRPEGVLDAVLSLLVPHLLSLVTSHTNTQLQLFTGPGEQPMIQSCSDHLEKAVERICCQELVPL